MQPQAQDLGGKSALPFGRFERTIAMRYVIGRSVGQAAISIISFLCIALAILAMITIMSIMNGFREQLVTSILGAQGHVYVHTVSDTPTVAEVDEMAGWLSAQDGVDIAFPVLNRQAPVLANGRSTGALVKGISPDDLNALNFVKDKVQFGDFSTFGQGEYGGDTVAIGQSMATTLGITVGDSITIVSPKPKSSPFGSTLTRKPYTVGAIFSLGYVDADSLYIYMPLEQALLFFEQGEASDEIEIRLENPDEVKDFGRHIRQNAPKAVYVSDWEDRSGSIAGALKVEQVAMRAIFTIVVIISVFPIVAAMIMLVKNKTRDIAILRTVGATRGSILRIFFTAGVTIGVAGTITGITLGLLFCLNIAPIQTSLESLFGVKLFDETVYQLTGGILPAKVVTSEVIAVGITGFLASALATILPAYAASRLDPVEAFRNE